MSRLAAIRIRLRLTLAFAVAMAVVLAATGLFLYVRLGDSLDRTIDQSLRERTADVGALARQSDSRLAERGASIAQILDPGGSVVDSTPELGRPLLTSGEIARAQRAQIEIPSRDVPGSDEPARVLARPVDTQRGRVVVVVGTSLETRSETLGGLLLALLIGGPLALALASFAGYGLAAAALRLVESMRREAESVSAAEPGRRLPLPPAHDETRRLAETLNGMLGRLESALARERRFVSDASHELRTPLASLRTELELALRRERTREEMESALRSAAEETERLSQLAEDLLVLARSETGTLPVRRERLAARELVAGVQQRYEHRAAAAQRPLDARVEKGLEISVDRLRAEQALGNLVAEAIRHAPEQAPGSASPSSTSSPGLTAAGPTRRTSRAEPTSGSSFRSAAARRVRPTIAEMPRAKHVFRGCSSVSRKRGLKRAHHADNRSTRHRAEPR